MFYILRILVTFYDNIPSFQKKGMSSKMILILYTQNWYSTTEVMLLDRLSYFLFPLPFHRLFSCTISHDYQI